MACNKTEQEIIDMLVSVAKEGGVLAPRAIVVDRLQKSNSLTRTVKIALVVPTNEVLLIDKLIFECLEFDDNLNFSGSSVNLQTDLEIDYLYFEAKIMAIKK